MVRLPKSSWRTKRGGRICCVARSNCLPPPISLRPQPPTDQAHRERNACRNRVTQGRGRRPEIAGSPTRRRMGVSADTPPGMSWHGQLDLHYQRQGNQNHGSRPPRGPTAGLAAALPRRRRHLSPTYWFPPEGWLVATRWNSMPARMRAPTPSSPPGRHPVLPKCRRQTNQFVHATPCRPGARLGGLPLESIAYRVPGREPNAVRTGAQCANDGMGHRCPGPPAAGQEFDSTTAVPGHFTQEIELPGIWLEQARSAARQTATRQPLGWAGNRVMATLWLAAGSALDRTLSQALLDTSRELQAQSPLAGAVAAPRHTIRSWSCVC